MNPEFVRFGVELAATGAGYGLAQGAEQIALDRIKASRQRIMEGHGQADVSDLPYGGPRRLVAGLALIGALTGYTAARGFMPNPASPTGEAPIVSAALDYNYISSTDGTASIEKNLTMRFDQNHSLDTKVYLASDGNSTAFNPVSNSELNKAVPYGPTTISATVSSNLANSFVGAPKEQSNLIGASDSVSGAELIEDDNDSLGDTNSIIQAANNAGNIPVYIVNVETAKPNAENVQNLKQIASATKGQYWAVTDQTVNTVLGEMRSTIHPHEHTQKPNDDRLPWRIVSGVLAVTGIFVFMQRRKSTAASV